MSGSEPRVENGDRLPRAGRWRQFRLRSLLILVALLAIASAIIGRHLYLQQRRSAALTAIRETGALLLTPEGKFASNDDRIGRVYLAGIDDEQLQHLVPHLAVLPHLRQLDIVQSAVTDDGLAALSDLTQLERLFVYKTEATPDGLAELGRKLPQLQIRQEAPEPVASGMVMRPVYRHAIAALAASPDGRWLAAGDGRGRLWLWRLDGGLPAGAARTTAAHEGWVFDAAFSCDGRLLATGGGDDRIVIWEPATLHRVAELTGHTDDVHAVAFVAADRKLVSASDDLTVRVWDVITGKHERTLSGHRDTIPGMAIGPDGETVATGSRDGDVRLWNIETGALNRVLAGHTADVMSVAFGPGGRLASASYDKTVRVWNLQPGVLPRTFAGHADWVFTVAFAQDGALVSGGRDGTLRRWDAKTGRRLAIREGQGTVSRIEPIPGSSLLAVATAEGRIRFWDHALTRCFKTLRVDFGAPPSASDGS